MDNTLIFQGCVLNGSLCSFLLLFFQKEKSILQENGE